MKKTLFIIVCILVVYYIIGTKAEASLKIPDEAIRFRVIANSNSKNDQDVKHIVKDEVQNYMSSILQNIDNIEVSRKIIINNLDKINTKIDQVLIRENYNYPFEVNFGLNYFPSKEYKGLIYEDGYYESLVITLGNGEGDNWWCVLFPPLCLLEAEEGEEVEYTSFVKELLNKYV